MAVLFYIVARLVAVVLAILGAIGVILGFIVAGARPFVTGIGEFLRHHRPHAPTHA